MLKFFCRMAVCAALVCPLAVSCAEELSYDDTELREQIDMIITKLYELEQKMNDEIQALEDMLKGKVMITDVETDATTGITTVTLTNGRELQLLPEKDMKSFVTYITSGGVEYWAYIDADGKKQYFLNEKGEAIPVKAEMPQVVTRGEDAFLLIGGVEYPLSGNSLFSDYDVIKDELTDEVIAVTFTFGEDMTFTVTVDGAAGLLFINNEGVLKEYYVTAGEKSRVRIQTMGVVDYVLQIPDGWRVKDGEDAQMGKYFEITAPDMSLIESGVAASEGELKVVAVLEGGKATVAKLNLTTEPFKEFVVSAGNATVRMTVGLVKYVYGVCEAGLYDEAEIYVAAESLLTSVSDIPAGYGVSTSGLEGVSLAQIAGSDLIAGREYVFWAVPAAYSDDEAEFYIKSGTIRQAVAKYGSVKFEVKDPAFRDAQVVLAIEGASSYYSGIVPKADHDVEHLLHVLNTAPESYTLKTETEVSGSVFEFAGVTAVEDTEYVAWLVIATEGREYVEADVIACEFKTLPLVSGSAVTVVAEEKSVSHNDVAVELTASGAEKIYYLYSETNVLPEFTSEDAKAKHVMKNGQTVLEETVVAKALDCMEKVRPETDLTLLALASDAEGKYSEVVEKQFRTAVLPSNKLEVHLSVALNSPEEVKINVSATGGDVVDYLYWIGKKDSNFWTSKVLLGGSAETAHAYIVANADASRFATMKERYPVVDGAVSITDHDVNVKYIMVAVAKDANDVYSDATVLEFMPHSTNIGTIVPKTDAAWKTADQGLKVDFIKDMFWSDGEFSSYSYSVTLPRNFTAYILSGTDSFFNDGDPSVVVTAEEKILKTIGETDFRRDEYGTTDDDIDLGWRYEHGSPKRGAVVVWANKEYHDKACKNENCTGNHTEVREWFGNTGVTVEHVVLFNDGNPVMMTYPYSNGNSGKVVDRVFIVLQDLDGNCYEPFEYDVPYEYFGEGGGGFGVDPE